MFHLREGNMRFHIHIHIPFTKMKYLYNILQSYVKTLKMSTKAVLKNCDYLGIQFVHFITQKVFARSFNASRQRNNQKIKF